MYTCYVPTKPTYQFIINPKFFDMIPNKSMVFPVDFAVVGLPERSGRHILQLPRPAAEAARTALGALLRTEELVLPNKTTGKIREKYGKNMVNIWEKYKKNMGKIW